MEKNDKTNGFRFGRRAVSYIAAVAAGVLLAVLFLRPAGSAEDPAREFYRDGGQLETNAAAQGEKAAGASAAAEEDFMFIDNWYMNTRVKFVLDGVWHRMGNVGEILDTAKRIRHTSELSWFREWEKTAERVKAAGDASLARGHSLSAGEAYLRAANYYFAAEVFLHTNPSDPRILRTYRKGGGYFLKGLRFLSVPVEEVHIPFEGTTLRGYFFRSPAAKRKAPVLIVHQGFDAPVEATKYIAEEAARRGYHCLLFEGPGQGLTIREQGLPFRPEWETVVTPVVEWLLSRPETDPDRLVLMGISLGGWFAARAAAFEHRLNTVILNPGYISIYDVFRDILDEKLFNLYEEDPEALNGKMLELTRYDVGIRWGLNHGMWVFGSATPAQFFTALKRYDNSAVLGQITSRVLVMDGSGEEWGPGQARELYERLPGPGEYMLFTEEESAEEHCQSGAPAVSTARLFDWLDEHLR